MASHVSKIRPVCLGVKKYLAGNSKVIASNRCDGHIHFFINPKGVETRGNEVVKGYEALGLATLTTLQIQKYPNLDPRDPKMGLNGS